jgi:hypothetical protein
MSAKLNNRNAAPRDGMGAMPLRARASPKIISKKCNIARRCGRSFVAAATDIDVIGTCLRAHEDSYQRGISVAFPDLVRRSQFWLPPEENEYVEQDYSGPRVCVRGHLRSSGVCWS